MQNKSKVRVYAIRWLLVLCLTIGGLMPHIVSANDDPQEGGRTRSGPRVTCTTTTYNLIFFVVVVTECSDGTRSTSIS